MVPRGLVPLLPVLDRSGPGPECPQVPSVDTGFPRESPPAVREHRRPVT
jgi:hypothetical protein